MEKKGIGDHYYNTDYKFSPRVRELLSKKLGEKEMSFMRAENIIDSVISGKYKEMLSKLNDKSKEKLMGLLKEKSNTNMTENINDVIVKFLNDNFDNKTIKEYIDYMLEKYKPGMVYMGVRISNHTIINLLEKTNVYPLTKGIIINKKYINDLLPFFNKDADQFNFDKETLMVDSDYTNEIMDLFDDISQNRNIKYYNDDDIFILSTTDEETEKLMIDSFEGLYVQSIPEHLFKWKTKS